MVQPYIKICRTTEKYLGPIFVFSPFSLINQSQINLGKILEVLKSDFYRSYGFLNICLGGLEGGAWKGGPQPTVPIVSVGTNNFSDTEYGLQIGFL